MRDSRRVSILKIEEQRSSRVEDDVVIEEPLEIRVNGESISVTMRTPGDDFDLAVGLLWTEGIIHSRDEIGTIAYCPDEEQPELKNIVNVGLVDSGRKLESSRRLWSNSSCGLCGKNSIADLMTCTAPMQPDDLRVAASTLYEMPTHLRTAQSVFTHTGGLHAAGLFSSGGELLLLREDIGRHNAVDKLIGHGLLHGTFPYANHILMVSGRTSFEIIQKALLARIPCIAAISAPSSLAVELADRAGITLIGFLRDHSMNVYTHPGRVV